MFRILRNAKRSVLKRKIGIVHLVLDGKIPFFKEDKSYIEKKVLPSPPLSLFELSQNLQRLSRDRSVRALIIEIGQPEFGGLADLHELRSIIEHFKRSGKPVWMIFHHINFSDYYLATVADKIFMVATGLFNVIGMSSTVNFYKDFMKQYGLEAQVLQVTPFKSAGNFLVYDEMPEEQKEMMNWLFDSMYNTIITAISTDRGKSFKDVQTMIDTCPMTEKVALEKGWIDGVISSGIEELIANEFGKIRVTDYFKAVRSLSIPRVRKRIAIIRAEGSIVDGKSSNSPLPIPIFGGKKMGDITIVQSIRHVIRNKKKFQAALFFVDSGGGSAVASETILQEMRKLSKQLPVFTYFHNVAGSGGYYIACFGRPIYSTPVTITGSIGVINLKFINKGFYDKQKIKQYNFNRGKNADIQSPQRPWNEKEYEQLKELIMDIYQTFVDHVASSRELDAKYVDSIGGGRVWTGEQGLEKKIVDNLKSFSTTLEDLDFEFKGITPVVIPTKVRRVVPPLIDKVSLWNELRDMTKYPLLIPYLDIGLF